VTINTLFLITLSIIFRYVHTRLSMLPVHNANEAVKTMFTIAKVCYNWDC